MSRYVFFDASAPSFEEVAERIKIDDSLPPDEQIALTDDVIWTAQASTEIDRFSSLSAASLPFGQPVIGGLFRALKMSNRYSAAEVRRRRAGVEAVSEHFGLSAKLPFAELRPAYRRLLDQLPDYHWRDGQRMLVMLSAAGIPLEDVTVDISQALRAAMLADPSLLHPDREWVKALRAWNWGLENVRDWPDLRLPMPNKERDVKARPWSAYPDDLRLKIEQRLQRKPMFATWEPGVEAALRRDEDGMAHSMECIRICIGALKEPPTELRDIVAPEPFGIIANRIYADAGKEVTRLGYVKLANLYALAARSGVLTLSELEELEKKMQRYRERHKAFIEKNPSRLAVRTHRYIDADNLTKLHALPETAFSKLEQGRTTRACSTEQKQPIVLALMLAGLSLTTIRWLEHERHCSEMEGEYRGCTLVSVPASETANKVERTAILPPAHSRIVHEFIRHYRPKLDISKNSVYLLPGVSSAPLRLSTISGQQAKFLQEHFDDDFRPELIRVLIRHLILAEDAEATALLGGVLGLRDHDNLNRLAKPYRENAKAMTIGELAVTGRLQPNVLDNNSGG